MSNPAQIYERTVVPHLFGPWAAHLVDWMAPRPGDRVLDVACGTGIVARRAAARVGPKGSVAALDFNANMLAVARATADEEGTAIDWHEGSADALPFPDGSFDLVLCQQGLQFFPERHAALTEMHRVLAPGGRVAVSVWRGLDHHPFLKTLFESIERHFGISGASTPFSLGDEAELNALLTKAGFGQVETSAVTMTSRFPDPEKYVAGVVGSATAAIPALQHLDDQARQTAVHAISRDVETSLSGVIEDGHVVFPWHAHLALAMR